LVYGGAVLADFFLSIGEVGFFDRTKFGPPKEPEEWATSAAIDRLERNKEVPLIYLNCIRLIQDEPLRRDAVLKLNQIFLFAKSKLGSDRKVRAWMLSGRLAGDSPYGLNSMTALKQAADRCLKIAYSLNNQGERYRDLESRLRVNPDDKRAISSIEKLEPKIDSKKNQINEYLQQFLDKLNSLDAFIGSGKV